MRSYFVAFKSRKTGIITWSSYENKEELDKYMDDIGNLYETVVEEGITSERCLELFHDPKNLELIKADLESCPII